jgi:hypothetical protein
MKLILVASVLFVFLFSSLAFASPFQGPVAFNHSCGCCQTAVNERVFTNPHAGWVDMPVESQALRCTSGL